MECPVNLTDIVKCQLVACDLTKAFVCKWKNLNNYSLKILTVRNINRHHKICSRPGDQAPGIFSTLPSVWMS